jgi:tricorn protease
MRNRFGSGWSRLLLPPILAACCVALLVLGISPRATGQSERSLILRHPTLSKTQVAFAYAGSIWVVGRDGGDARRLTVGGHETDPIFSPDGSQIAFTGEYNGNADVYIVSAQGGEPRRVTWHPGGDFATNWTPDGKRILFVSLRATATDPGKFFTISRDGGFPTELPLPMADEGSFSPDGGRIAYVPNFQWQASWKRYRGGQTQPIWIVNLADSSIVDRIPRENSNDFNPMWVGNNIYFLSDRNGPASLFVYDLGSKQVSEAVKNEGLDFKTASAGPDGIVLEQFGGLLLFDYSSGKTRRIKVRVTGDFSEVRPHFAKVDAKQILNAGISPGGSRALFEARGEIFTVPAEKGDIRNLTNSPAVADRDPAWSPDGLSIAWFSDESGEYALHIRNQSGLGEVRKINLGNPPSFFYTPTWSPDSKKIAYSDKRLNLWYVDLGSPTPIKVDTDLFDTPLHEFDVAWSPDNKWLTYTKQLPNHLRAAFVYSLGDHKITQITDGLSDVLYPGFDKNGKYLYFTASTNEGLTPGWLDMTSEAHPVTRSVYVVVLAADLPSPLAPESDEEKTKEQKKEEKQKEKKEEKKDAKQAEASTHDRSPDKSSDQAVGKSADKSKDEDKENEAVNVKIDFDGIGQRILALPIPAQNYVGLLTGKEGVIYLAQDAPVDIEPGPPAHSLVKFDLKTRKTEPILDGVSSVGLSDNGEKLLYEKAGKYFIVAAEKAPKPGDGALNLASMEVYVEPKAEWRQMYQEVWRIERDFLYDPHFHGLDLQAAEKFYAPFLDGISSRGDLNYLFTEMLGNITVGHMFIGGGDMPEPPKVSGGLLGADYAIENGRYRFAKIYNGENWNPELKAPLTQPGVRVKAGEYLLAVNGRELRATENIYSFFEETAGKQVVLKVGPNPDGKDSREVTAVPVANEHGLRNLDWIESNRRKVDELSDGKLAYVYLPNTAEGGFTNFNRYFFAQVGKEGAVIDERFNHGGQLADYVVDYLRRPIMSWVATREGQPFSSPSEAIYGPKVMLINQFSGSGGDALPWYFRKLGIGPLVGTRTWGGLVGIGGYPELIDGGRVTAPRWAIYGLKGDWEVENHGIAPDIEVEMDPKLVREGHDPQLERAIAEAMDMLKKNPQPTYPLPPYPDYHQRFPATP